jgi:hypothetical protein
MKITPSRCGVKIGEKILVEIKSDSDKEVMICVYKSEIDDITKRKKDKTKTKE